MLTAEQIAAAKVGFPYRDPNDILHEHDDCIRMCHEWLSAQMLIKNREGRGVAGFRSLIIHWAGSYVSKDDVMVAASFLPELRLDMHTSNLSRRLVLPNDRRLAGLSAAMRHPNQRGYLQDDIRRRIYHIIE